MQEQHQIPMNLQQREEVRDCVRLPEQTQSPAPERVQTKMQWHTRLMENLPPEQKSQMRNRVQEMEQMMNRLEDPYQDMETAMGGGN